MLAGHYATALVAYQKYPKGTLLYFLFASQLQDLLWFTFHYLGLERTTPSDVFDTTVNNMVVNMLYSHDVIPLIAWLIIIFLIGKFIFKEKKNRISRFSTGPWAFCFRFLFRSSSPHFWIR